MHAEIDFELGVAPSRLVARRRRLVIVPGLYYKFALFVIFPMTIGMLADMSVIVHL